MNKKILALIIILIVVLGGYFALHNKAKNVSTLETPGTAYYPSYAEEKAFTQITWDYSVAPYFNIYRSTDQKNWQIIAKKYPQISHAATDKDLPKDSLILYYRVAPVDENNKEGVPSPVATLNISTSPNTQADNEVTPVIYSITPSSGPIGTKITIKGKNLRGFEGDLNARIATEFNTADYSSGIMYGERTDSTDTITTTIQSKFCKQDTSYSGLPCKEYFYVTPGVYEISVKPWSTESNSVSFTVTK